MAGRPEHFIAEAQVVSAEVMIRQPDPVELVRRLFRRDLYGIAVIHGRGIGLATPPRDPAPVEGLEDRVEGGGEAAGRTPDDQLCGAVAPSVLIRLAIAHDDQLPVAKHGARDRGGSRGWTVKLQ
jgi:hypothetical protein